MEKEDFSDTVGSSPNENLKKLAHVFDNTLTASVLHTPTPSPRPESNLHNRIHTFTPPTEGPNTQTSNPGRPIDIATARNLRTIILGFSSHSFTSDWKKFFFNFRETKSDIPYGLDASFPGPRALTLCVQAHVLRSLMFSQERARDESIYFGKSSPRPTQMEQMSALVEAFTDILWKVGLPLNRTSNSFNNQGNKKTEKRQVIITLVGYEPCFCTKRSFIEDGFTEKLWLYTVYSKSEVRKFIRRNIHYFCCRAYPGAVMLLYSIVLSRTVDVIMKDMGQRHTSLLTDNARTTQALINLLLAGYAAPFLHNGVIRCDSQGKALQHPLPGLRSRSDLGFLFFNKNEPEKKRTEVGSMYRTPIVPIWVTQINGTYAILFCTSRDLVTDWKTERYFNLHYYNGHFTQEKETILTLDTRTRVESIDLDRQITIWDDEEEKEKKQPSLEMLIFTKWPEAGIDWNGESPYY